jgi:pimeloyl-ACP methyl ester carboxylesterase
MSDNAKMVRVQGLDFQVRDGGDQQPALVFLHYWGGTGRTWDLVIRELSGRHRCVAPDLRGYGRRDGEAGLSGGGQVRRRSGRLVPHKG